MRCPGESDGLPVTIHEGIDVALDGSSASYQHAQLVPGVPVTRNWSSQADEVSQYFNTAAFLPPSKVAPDTYGNSPRNFITGPGLMKSDFSAIEDFKVNENLRVQVRSEFFNVF